MEPAEAKSKPPRRRLTTFGRVVVGLFAAYFLVTMNPRSLGLPIGDWPWFPRHIFTTTTATLTYDEEEVVMAGTTQCTRRSEKDEDGESRWWVLLPMHFGYLYTCEPRWIGHRLDDGSALLVGAYSYRSPRLNHTTPPRGERHFDADMMIQRIGQIPPAVIWLDDAEEPTRAEYYFTAEAFADPRSRLTKVDYEIEMWAASAWTRLFTWRSVTDPSDAVPFRDTPAGRRSLVGHFFIEHPPEAWSEGRAAAEALETFQEPAVFNPWQQFPEAQARAIAGAASGAKKWRPQMSTSVVPGSASAARDGEAVQGARRRSQTPFAIRPLAREGGAFRVSAEEPQGMLPMYLAQGNVSRAINYGPQQFDFKDHAMVAEADDLWRARFLYDPASGSLLRGDFVVFSSIDLR